MERRVLEAGVTSQEHVVGAPLPRAPASRYSQRSSAATGGSVTFDTHRVHGAKITTAPGPSARDMKIRRKCTRDEEQSEGSGQWARVFVYTV